MHFTMSTSDMPVGLLLIDTDTQPTGAEDSSDHSLAYAYMHSPTSKEEKDRLKNVCVALAGAGKAATGQQVQTVFLKQKSSDQQLLLSFVHTQVGTATLKWPAHPATAAVQ
eukprot:jgi/Chrzof1/11606/Cz06g02020.t1